MVKGYNYVFYMESQWFQQNLLKSLSFPQESEIPILSYIVFPYMHSSVSVIFILFLSILVLFEAKLSCLNYYGFIYLFSFSGEEV